jgi:acetyl-CoA carboxylase carboxyl transferase subunit beta
MAITSPIPAATARTAEKNVRTEGLWTKCLGCRQTIWKADLEANLNVCPKCQHHFKMAPASGSICCLSPAMSWSMAAALHRSAQLHRREAIQEAPPRRAGSNRPGRRDSQCGGPIGHHSVVLSAMEYALHRRVDGRSGGRDHCPRRGSGAHWPQAADRCAASGGARMMEGVVSLMQMAKISTALASWTTRRCPTSACSPIPQPAASPPASPCWAI